MDIEKHKKNFLNFLRTEYNAKQGRQKEKGDAAILDSSYYSSSLDEFENDEHLSIAEDVLKKYEFSGTDFWEIICPALQAEGYIGINGVSHHLFIKSKAGVATLR